MLRPAAAQWGASSAAAAAPLRASSSAMPRVQLLALTRQDRRVDGFREQRVAETEAVHRLIGDEDAVLDRLVQRLAHLRLAKSRDSAEERVTDVASDGRCHSHKALRLTVEPIHALQQQVAQTTRKLAALVARSREELFGEEGVSFRAGDDLCRSASPVGESRSGPRAASSAPRTRAARARGEAPSPSDEPPPRAGACAPPRKARPRGRWRAARPPGCRGCARGRR